MIKIWYTGFMEHDTTLYNVEAGRNLQVQNLSMHEEMGQISYLFCDKTGTLTKNQLIFREMAVLKGKVNNSINSNDDQDNLVSNGGPWQFKKLDASESLDNILRCILICHDVLRIDGKLSGSSQDELVLMEMIELNYNSSFVTKDSDSITIKINDQTEVYTIVKIYEFSSDRKMMSVTVKRSDG